MRGLSSPRPPLPHTLLQPVRQLSAFLGSWRCSAAPSQAVFDQAQRAKQSKSPRVAARPPSVFAAQPLRGHLQALPAVGLIPSGSSTVLGAPRTSDPLLTAASFGSERLAQSRGYDVSAPPWCQCCLAAGLGLDALCQGGTQSLPGPVPGTAPGWASPPQGVGCERGPPGGMCPQHCVGWLKRQPQLWAGASWSPVQAQGCVGSGGPRSKVTSCLSRPVSVSK